MKALREYLKDKKRYHIYDIEARFLSDEVKECLTSHNFTLRELCYRITHNIDLEKKFICPICGKPIRFNDRGYNNTCSVKCGRVNGVAKTIETLMKTRGVVNVFQLPEVKAKTIDTNKKLYGKERYVQTEEYKQRNKAFWLDKLGVESIFQSEQFKQLVKEQNLEEYGKEYYTQTDKCKKQTQETNIKKRGVPFIRQQHIKNFELLTEEYVRQNFIKDGYFLIREAAEFYNISVGTFHKQYKPKFHITEMNKQYKFHMQMSVYEYIKSIYPGEIQLNTRGIIAPQELDIYIPEKHLAIEFDGLMFHSYGISEKSMFNNADIEDINCHLSKTLACKSLNIQLLHIFENEWVEKEAIWKSMLAAKLGVTKTKIYARKCEIKPVDKADAYEFLKINHLQGSCSSNINLGLYYNNELISLMTFGKSRFTDKYTYELLRFCNKLNTVVVGGASKLLKFFRSIYSGSIISYANRRWSDGELYKALGFTNIDETTPECYYFKEDTHKVYNKLEFKQVLEETENMYNNGYRKIYDCGNLVFTMA